MSLLCPDRFFPTSFLLEVCVVGLQTPASLQPLGPTSLASSTGHFPAPCRNTALMRGHPVGHLAAQLGRKPEGHCHFLSLNLTLCSPFPLPANQSHQSLSCSVSGQKHPLAQTQHPGWTITCFPWCWKTCPCAQCSGQCLQHRGRQQPWSPAAIEGRSPAQAWCCSFCKQWARVLHG